MLSAASPADAPAVLLLFDIGPLEFLILAAAAVMLFGGELPDVARKAGRMVRKLRTLASEAARNLETPDIGALPGGDELRRELDLKGELDLKSELDVKAAAGIDWHEVARLPDAEPVPPAAGRTEPDSPDAPAAAPR
jgi:Sec-independent protein translocase protein TatA